MTEASVAARVVAIRERIARSCETSGREPESVRLVGASKRQPLERIVEAVEAGLVDLGENRVQEAREKQDILTSRRPDLDLRWHFFGPLQSNKAKLAARLFDSIHSIDRLKIAKILNRQAAIIGKRLQIFIQINIGGESNKSGIHDPRLVDRTATELVTTLQPYSVLENLDVVGLMAIPPFESEAAAARLWFRRLRELRDEVHDSGVLPGFAGHLSMGMSHDYDIAIEEGATHIRIGTALFGARTEIDRE